MVPTLDDSLLREGWHRDLDLFFVNSKFGRLANDIRGAQDYLRELVDVQQVPTDLQALTEGRAVSILNVCRLRFCLEEARRRKHVPLLFLFNVDLSAEVRAQRELPVKVGSIIPSINVFDPRRYSEVKEALGISEGELTMFASKAARKSLNVSYFEGELEKGSLSGHGERSGYYRLTDYMAGIVYSFLQSKAEPLGYQLEPQNYYLPRDPSYGPGKGKWCKSLVRNRGNYWPS
jgi:hypothetical protein